MKQLSQIYLLLLLITGVVGCSSANYYSQAVSGHLSLMMAGEPVERLIASDSTEPALKAKLLLSQQALDFARDRLALPTDDAYSDFVTLDHPWVVVNLVAVPEFSLTPHRWCYPIVGCQAYRGYFDLADARAEQARFDARNYDTFLGGVTAYSTLGWFDDPLHTGFTNLTDGRMVALMFHELAHRVVYIAGDTRFNESFATAVELEGLRLWAREYDNPDMYARARQRLDYRAQTLAMVKATSARLETLYGQPLPEATLRARKAEILASLLADYLNAAEQWQQPGPFGANPSGLNNANLALFRQYNDYVPGFRQLLRELDYDFPTFYRQVENLSERPEPERKARLKTLSERFYEDF